MFSKIIFVLAAVCVVNASVLTGNVFDDDPETQDASNPKDCNLQECDQLCRRLKFRGGVCVNGRCKCDNFLNAEDETENTLSDLEDSVLQEDDSETEVEANPSRCNLKACDLVCRWLKKTSGSCVDGRCKCTKSLIAEDETENILSDLEDSVLQEDDPETEVIANPSRCNLKACDLVCRWLKKTSGSCVDGRCKCSKSLIAEDEAEAATNPKKCTYKVCYAQCRSSNYTSGVCVNGRCKCSNSRNTKDAVDENSEFATIRVCKLTKCVRKCTRRGYEGASCVNGRCKCNNKTQGEDEIFENTLSEVEDLVSRKEDDSDTEVAVEMQVDVEEVGTEGIYLSRIRFRPPRITRRIRFLRCKRTCTRLGYKSARVVNGRCNCYKKIQREDASLFSDVTSDENEEPIVILRTNED